MQDMNIVSIEAKLLDLAISARSKAYAPYSNFAVGSAVESASGKVYSGCNVENISYPVGTCAEAGAIAAMVADGERKIRRILVVAETSSLIAPCGACLQRIKEFADEKTQILLATPDGIKKILTIEQLLPFGFDNEELKK